MTMPPHHLLPLFLSLLTMYSTPLISSGHGTPTGEYNGDCQWFLQERAPPLSRAELVFAVPHQNAGALEEHFWRVSNPDSPHYRKFVGTDELHQVEAHVWM